MPKFVKGHPGYKPKGAKAKTTILREERRAIFDAEMSRMYLEKIQEAKAEYLLDQFLGKVPDVIDVNAKFIVQVSQDVVDKYKVDVTTPDAITGR